MREALIAVTAVAGLFVGTRLRVLAFRHSVPAGVPGRTGCPSCGSQLAGSGWLASGWLRPDGRCPECPTRIGPPYAIVELVTGAVFGLLAWRFADHRLPVLLVAASACVALAVIDIAVHRLPDRITLVCYPLIGALAVGSSLLLGDGEALLRALWGLLGYAGVLLVLALPSGGIGLGDVKLAGLLGGLLAWIEWSALVRGALIAVLLAGGFAAALLVSRRAGRHSHMPLGPFMVAGALISLLATT